MTVNPKCIVNFVYWSFKSLVVSQAPKVQKRHPDEGDGRYNWRGMGYYLGHHNEKVQYLRELSTRIESYIAHSILLVDSAWFHFVLQSATIQRFSQVCLLICAG